MTAYKPGKLIDFHVHVFPDDLAPKAVERFIEVRGYRPMSNGTLSDTLIYMDKIGIDICVPQPVATRPSQVRDINDWALSIRSERVIPFGAIHPDFQNVDDEIKRLVDLGFRGVKLQPDWQGFYPDEERALPMYEAATKYKIAVLFHAGREIEHRDIIRSTGDRLLRIHRLFPDLEMIVAHMGGYQSWTDAEQNLVGTGVYLDMSHCPEEELPDERLVNLIRTHGTSKILFASDFPFADPAKGIERLIRLPLSVDEKEDIAWRNAERILGERGRGSGAGGWGTTGISDGIV